MDSALWLLLRLRIWGWLRRMGRSLATVKGACLTALGLSLLAPQLLAVFVFPRPEIGPERLEMVRRFGTLGLFGYCLLTLVLSSREQAIYFSPAEIDFLFPGPFRRRRLLAYKLAGQMMGVVLMAVLSALACAQQAAWLVAGFVGMFLALVFLQLFSVAVALVANTAGVLARGRGPRLAIAAVAVLALAGWIQAGRAAAPAGPWERLAQIEQTGLMQAVLSPLRWFVEAFAAERLWPDLVQWAGLGLAVDAALLALVFALDAQYLETSAAASARLYARIERMRRGGIGPTLRAPGRRRIGLPMGPRWGGAGPVAWRQLTTAGREFTRVLVVALALAVPLIPALLGARHSALAVLVVEGILFGMTIVLTSLMPFDFRVDVERMAELKALPIRSSRLAIGQLIAPVVLMTVLQWTALGLLGLRLRQLDGPAWLIAAFAAPSNALLFGVENLACLLFPARWTTAAGFDIQATGRLTLLIVAKAVILALATFVATGVGSVLYFLTGSLWAALATGWVVLAGCAAGFVPFLALAFRRYDVARDTPA